MSAYDEHVMYTKLRGLEFDGYGVPNHTQHCLENYYYYKLEPGGFMTALLSGYDIDHVTAMADNQNQLAVPEIIRFVQEQLPDESFGSREKVKKWVHSRFEG